ncbi:hypothetical protein BCM02_1239 [Paenibacillus methanolicus]|uniref:Uncharacterized protein n=1 Tax=Paenibacillus methanolicus TaxID=582686 RepID=A0A5S5BL31_9BACL|nr:hypothetical protein BCM02_1239 [Paenibacillus methanolicus]
MRRSEIKAGSVYDNGPRKGKWYAQRRVEKIVDDVVFYTVVGGRDPGRKGSITIVHMARWAVREITTTCPV